MALHDAELARSLEPNIGAVSLTLTLPLDPALVGQHLFSQFATVDPTANAGGVVTSNGVETTIGGQRA